MYPIQVWNSIPKLEIVLLSYRRRQASRMQVILQTTFKAVLIATIGCYVLSTIPAASAIAPVWVNGPHTLNDGSAGNGIDTVPVIIRVTDCAADTTGGPDTVTVQVTSSVDPVGIELTLTETGGSTCIFENTNLALMNDNNVFSLSDTVTITVFDDTGAGPTIGDILVISDSDFADGLEPVFTETSPGSNLYTAKINFGAATDAATNTLEASPGDIISVIDLDGGNVANGIISPNPSGGKGAITAEVGGSVTAEYDGDSESFTVSAYPGPGRGSGGLLVPGLVVDVIVISTLLSGGCTDCIPPTLGLDERNRRLVDGGFSYNGNAVDVELFYTEYPLITVNVGDENKAILKVYENSGLQDIEHVELAFGLRKGQILAESKAVISLDIGTDKTETISTFDPENVLQDIRIDTTTDRCSITISGECMIITIHHTFRAPLDFNMVATNVWDFNKNAWQNYFNDGIQVVGQSLNPPVKHVGIHNGKSVHIVKTGESKGVDDDGNGWTFDKIWTKDYIPPEKKPTLTSHGYDRFDIGFQGYKQEQEVLAQKTLDKILLGKKLVNESPKEPHTIEYHYTTREQNEALQMLKVSEEKRAQEFLEKSGIKFSQYKEAVDE